MCSIGGNRYLYYRVKSKRVQGKLKHERRVLGKLIVEHDDTQLIPNDFYFEHMGMQLPVGEIKKGRGRPAKNSQDLSYRNKPEHSTLGFGYSIACHKIAQDLGLWEDLTETFGDARAREILAVAAYMAYGSPAGMSALEYFVQKHMLFTDTILNSSRLSTLYLSISAQDRGEFFERWIRRHATDDNICYDVTSISSYAKNIPTVSFGYNRDKEKLAQVNLGMFCTMQGGLPVFYADYNGSINDFSNFPYVLRCAQEHGLGNKFLLVMDGGFAVDSNIDFTAMCGVDFLMGAPQEFGIRVQDMLSQWRSNEKDRDSCY